MSDQPVEPTAATDDDQGLVEIDIAAFLPPGVTLAGSDEAGPDEAGPDEVEPMEAAPVEGAPAAPPINVDALTRIEGELAAVDLALAALDDGTYGRCLVSAAAIDDALLAADPVRRGCASHPQPAPAVVAASSPETASAETA